MRGWAGVPLSSFVEVSSGVLLSPDIAVVLLLRGSKGGYTNKIPGGTP